MLTAAAVLVAGIIAFSFVARMIQRPFYSRFDRVRRVLPGYNCGACGFAECADYAIAVVQDRADPLACVPGGAGTAYAIADTLNTVATVGESLTAVVRCNGGKGRAKRNGRYEGIKDCRAALLVSNGFLACGEGCLGLGSCVAACPFGAISISGDELAVIDRQRCNGCGACLPACPRNLLSMMPRIHSIYLACNSHGWGAEVAEQCTVGCTACGECIDVTPSGAIVMRNHLPQLDYGIPGENFLAAAYRCPSNCFVDCIKVRPKANITTGCNGCGACLSACPVEGAITGRKGERHVVNKDLCIGCGRCLTACPVRAISLWGGLGYVRSSKVGK